jgi:hypothetical protein
MNSKTGMGKIVRVKSWLYSKIFQVCPDSEIFNVSFYSVEFECIREKILVIP